MAFSVQDPLNVVLFSVKIFSKQSHDSFLFNASDSHVFRPGSSSAEAPAVGVLFAPTKAMLREMRQCTQPRRSGQRRQSPPTAGVIKCA